MKFNCWLFLGAMLSSSLLAQQVTNAPIAGAVDSSATNAAAGSTKKKSTPKKKKEKTPAKSPSAELRTVPLVPGPATVEANNVNVRGQAKLKSEVVTRLTKG